MLLFLRNNKMFLFIYIIIISFIILLTKLCYKEKYIDLQLFRKTKIHPRHKYSAPHRYRQRRRFNYLSRQNLRQV